MRFKTTLSQEKQNLLIKKYHTFMKQNEFHHLIQCRLAFECLEVFCGRKSKEFCYPSILPDILGADKAIFAAEENNIDDEHPVERIFFSLLLSEDDFPAELAAALDNWIILYDAEDYFNEYLGLDMRSALQEKRTEQLTKSKQYGKVALSHWVISLVHHNKGTWAAYETLSDEQKIVRLAKEFVRITKNWWINGELSLLPDALEAVGVPIDKPVSYDNVLTEAFADKEWRQLFPESLISIFPDHQHRLALAFFQKMEELRQDKSQMVQEWMSYLKNSGSAVLKESVCLALCRKYFHERENLLLGANMGALSMIFELLYSLRIACVESDAGTKWEYIPSAEMYEEELGMQQVWTSFKEENYHKALELLYALAKGGSSEAQYELASKLQWARSNSLREIAKYWWEKSWKENRNILSAFHTKINNEKVEGLQWKIRELAEMGNSKAMIECGFQKIDSEKMYRQAALQGNPEGQYQLAYSYYYRYRERKCFWEGEDYVKCRAIQWYKKAAEQGHMIAQQDLAELLWPAPCTFWESVDWYRKRVEQEVVLYQLFPNAERDEREKEGYDEYEVKFLWPRLSRPPCQWKLPGTQEGRQKKKWHIRDLYVNAKNHNSAAQYELGLYLRETMRWEKGEAAAFPWLQKAAEQGYVKAQTALGICYQNGNGVEQDASNAVDWYRKAASKGDAQAEYNLGVCYEFGEGIDRNEAVAVQWYRRAADRDYAPAQFRLAKCLQNGIGTPANSAEAMDWCYRAGKQDYGPAQYMLSQICDFGLNDPCPAAEFLYWCKHAVYNDDPEGICRMGVYDVEETGWTRDGQEKYREAIVQGSIEAIARLAIFYFEHGGAPLQNILYMLQIALKLHQQEKDYKTHTNKTAKEGNAKFQFLRARKYFRISEEGIDRTVPEERRMEAAVWYRRAAIQGHREAQYCYAKCCEYGLGVDDVDEDAAVWYHQAALQGHTDAQERLEELFAHF